MLRYSLASCLVCLAACGGGATPLFDINFASTRIANADLEAVVPQIDAAMAAALALRHEPEQVLDKQFVYVYFVDAPQEILGERLSGAATGTQVQSIYFPCLFDPRSALVHEFLHVLSFVRHGDPDAAHHDVAFAAEPAERARLRALHCTWAAP